MTNETMVINKAKAKRCLALGTTWTVKNSHNPNWNPGPREIIVVQTNAVGFRSVNGTSWLSLDQTDDKIWVNESGTRIEVRDSQGNVGLTYEKV
jgi:predicted metalloprotease with PDZ domain